MAISEHHYRQDLEYCLERDRKIVPKALRSYRSPAGITKAKGFFGQPKGRTIYYDDFSDPSKLCKDHHNVVIIIENIDFSWMVEIGRALSIDPAFFARYTESIYGPNKWKSILGPNEKHRDPQARYKLCNEIEHAGGQWRNAQYWHIDGVFGHKPMDNKDEPDADTNRVPRTASRNEKYGWTRATRISCWMTSVGKKQIRIILVDGPFLITSSSELHPRLRMQLYLPVSRNRDGLFIPQSYDKEHNEAGMSLMYCLEEFFSHGWQHDLLFRRNGIVKPVAFWHLVAASIWRTNLAHLDKHIKYLSLIATRSAKRETIDSLHDARLDIDTLREQVNETLDEMPELVDQECQDIGSTCYVRPPSETLRKVEKSSRTLEKFLIDSFTLFLSSVSIRQSVRAQQLTVLAFIYVPLSFVTGVFGMNIDVINQSPLSIWVVIAVLAVTIVLTVIIYEVTELWERFRMKWMYFKRRKEQQQELGG